MIQQRPVLMPKKIRQIQFALLSPTEIRKMSATKIITADTYDDDGFPIEMGLMDLRLGVIEPGLRCKTCWQKVDECPGHFGSIDLALPVIHVGYTKVLKTLLRSSCRRCGRALLTQEMLDDYHEQINEADQNLKTAIWKGIEKQAVKAKACPHCEEEQKKVVLDKPCTFREDGHKLTPKDIRERLEKIPDHDLLPLGIDPKVARPEWIILKVLPVPPITVRPSITLESGDRSEDDLTHKLVDVLRINQRLRENRDAGAPQLIVEDLWELLQYHVTTYFDNQTSGIPPARHRSGRPLKTLTQRLKGKEGRFRSNLSGKRVNFCARTVISPDPWISINEVGVPRQASMELTVPTRVTEWNIELLREMVLRGPDRHPGVNYIIRRDGQRIKITERNAELVANERLEPGVIVERHLMNGDVVIFNRQPSLHRMSMMVHEVRVMHGKTFRLNLNVCPPYNADFDGDEMNLHVVQSEEARAEARILMRVQEHILSPRFGGSIIGGIHDQITGGFLLTHNDPHFTTKQALFILSMIQYRGDLPEPVEERDGQKFYSGLDLFSIIIPNDINLRYNSAIGNEVEIRDGRLIKGTVDENTIGSFKGKLLDKVVHDYGSDRGRLFIDQSSRMTIGAVMALGFTTSIEDEDIPATAKTEIRDILEEAKADVEELIAQYEEGTLAQHPGRTLEETLEVEIMSRLGRSRSDSGQVAEKHLGLENAAVIMAKSGARGSMMNLSQMAGSIGQQAVRGERIKRGYTNRTLPHFKPGDKGAEAHGFVKSSYKSGLNPTEFFFHSIGGREGLVDTAVRTSRSGYMQRRLINALDDLKVMKDGTVRNTAGNIIQFDYGEDGVDPSRSYMGATVNIDDVIFEYLGDREED